MATSNAIPEDYVFPARKYPQNHGPVRKGGRFYTVPGTGCIVQVWDLPAPPVSSGILEVARPPKP